MISRLELPEKKSIITAPGSHILLVFDYARSFKTPIIKNHSVTSKSTLVVLGGDSAHSFGTPSPKNHGITSLSAQILLGSDSLRFQHNNRTHSPGQKLPPPGKYYLCFQMGGKNPMLHSVPSHVH